MGKSKVQTLWCLHRIAYLDLARQPDPALAGDLPFRSGRIGIEVASSAVDQLNHGHYIPVVGRRLLSKHDVSVAITWAAQEMMTLKFFAKYNDQSIVYLTKDAIAAGRRLRLCITCSTTACAIREH